MLRIKTKIFSKDIKRCHILKRKLKVEKRNTKYEAPISKEKQEGGNKELQLMIIELKWDVYCESIDAHWFKVWGQGI